MASSIDTAFLRSSDLFENQPDEVLKAVLLQGRLEEYGPGQVVFEQGDQGDRLYIVKSGALEVLASFSDGADPVPVAYLGPGEVLGELALLTGSPRSASVRAPEHAELFTVEKSVPTGGSRPVDVALSPDGKRAWVSHGDSGDLRVLDAVSLDVLATIPVGPRAWWTALTPDGSRLYVTVGRAGDVAVVDTAAGKVITRIPAGKLPWGVALVEVP